MSIDKLEAFIEFAQHLEKEHDIPFTSVRAELLHSFGNHAVFALSCNDESDWPHAIFEYNDQHDIFYYKLVGDNKYYYRLKKNDDAVDNKDPLTSLKDKCMPLIDNIEKSMLHFWGDQHLCVIIAKQELKKIKDILSTTEEKE